MDRGAARQLSHTAPSRSALGELEPYAEREVGRDEDAVAEVPLVGSEGAADTLLDPPFRHLHPGDGDRHPHDAAASRLEEGPDPSFDVLRLDHEKRPLSRD